MTQLNSILHEIKINKTMFLMLLPTLVLFFIFSYIPMVGVYYAFTRYTFTGGLFGSQFVGLENFKFLYQSSTLFIITRNTILYNAAFILIGNTLQIFTAVLLSVLSGKIFKKIAQSIIFLPYFVSFVLLGAFVYNIFNYEFGFLNSFLKSIHVHPIDVYGTPSYWKYILTGFYIWKNLGYGTVIYLAAIMNIEQSFYEAAEIDGANVFQQVRYFTLPQLKTTFIILILFSLGSIMRGQFELFYQIVGSNGILFNATDIIDTFVYRTLTENFDIGMGTAAGLYQSLFGFILIVSVNSIIKKHDPDYSLF